MNNSMQLLKQLESNGKSFCYYSFERLADQYDLSRLPFAAKILLENLLRRCTISSIAYLLLYSQVRNTVLVALETGHFAVAVYGE